MTGTSFISVAQAALIVAALLVQPLSADQPNIVAPPVRCLPSPLPELQHPADCSMSDLTASPWRMKFMMYRDCPLLHNRAACLALYLDPGQPSCSECADMKVTSIDFELSFDYTKDLMVRIVQGDGFWADTEIREVGNKRILTAENLSITMADVWAMPGGMMPVCLAVADDDVNVVSGQPADGMIAYTLHSDSKPVCCPGGVTAAIAHRPSPAPAPCASPRSASPTPSACVKAQSSPRCPSPKPSPCVAAHPSPRCASQQVSPCAAAQPFPRCSSPQPSPCVQAQPSPRCSSPRPSPCVVTGAPSPRCSSPRPSPCVQAQPSPACVHAAPSPKPCQPRTLPSPRCEPKCQTVVSVLHQRPPCTTSLFLQLIKAAGMEHMLGQAASRGATMFVPTNQAIETTLKLLGIDMDYILQREVAIDIVNYHIAENKQVYAYQVPWAGVFLYTRNYWADALYLYRDGSKGDIAVVSAQTDAHLILDDGDNQNVNIKTCSGVLHFVDAMLVSTSVVEQYKHK